MVTKRKPTNRGKNSTGIYGCKHKHQGFHYVEIRRFYIQNLKGVPTQLLCDTYNRSPRLLQLLIGLLSQWLSSMHEPTVTYYARHPLWLTTTLMALVDLDSNFTKHQLAYAMVN